MTSPQPHCSSYYAASRNDHTVYPALQGEVDADVCVIGGGFTGVSTALTLAERGMRVALLEQNSISWGASGRNGGQMIGGMPGEGRLSRHWQGKRDDLLWNLGYRGHDIISERIAKYQIDCDFKRGYIEVAVKNSHLSDLKQLHQAHVDHAMAESVRLIDAGELASLIGTRAYQGGLLNTHSGHLHPLNLCLGEARAAAGLGVGIFEDSKVLSVEHGSRPRVVCAGGAVSADFVVLAGNAYHRLEQKSLRGRLFPAGSYIIATESLGVEEAKEINALDAAVCDTNEIVDYFRLSADRRMLFGGRCNYSNRDPKDIAAAMLPLMHKIYPQLKDKRIDYAWGGKVGIVVNRVPMMGRIAPNIIYCQGYSGHGVNMTHACGEVLADAIAGTMESFDFFADVTHRPIPFSQWFGNQAVAAGMMYYRLKDRL